MLKSDIRKEIMMIYLDNSATTKADDSVINSFRKVSESFFANPSSIHKLGAEVEQLQTKARQQAAELLQVDPKEVVFTSGGTEGDNMAIKGIALQYQSRGKHIITTEIEHAAVYEACQGLEKLGFEVTYLPVNSSGVVDLADVRKAIRPDTILISVMHVNNEIGSIQPIEAIGDIAKEYPKLFFHVDAVQSLGKMPINFKNSGIDLCSFSGHKIHGLKGTGLLYVKHGVTLFPLFHGGGQEEGIRSGTENVAGNISFVRALRLIKEKEKQEYAKLEKLHMQLLSGLRKIEGLYVNSSEDGAAHIVNVSVPGLKPEVVIHALFEEGIIISTQSACSSKDSDKSRVLKACGFSDDRTTSGLRISLTYENTEQEIEACLHAMVKTIKNLKAVMG